MSSHDSDTYHPGPTEYIQIGVILAVLTAIEVGLYFFDVITSVAIPALIVLTVLKFLLVVFWFMHLRFDTPLFRRLFFTGVGLALVLFAIVLAIFRFEPPS